MSPKTCMLDQIPMSFPFECSDEIVPQLSAIVNLSLLTGVFPSGDRYESSHGQIPFEKSALDPNVLETIRLISNLLCPNLLRKLFLTNFFVIWIKTIFGTPSSQFITQNTVLRLCFQWPDFFRFWLYLHSDSSGSKCCLWHCHLKCPFDTLQKHLAFVIML